MQQNSFMKRYSENYTKFKSDDRSAGGTIIQCDCGWRGPIREATEIFENNREGERVMKSTCCKRCFKAGDIVILFEETYDPPLTMAQQVAADRLRIPQSKRNRPKDV